jgi:hypothetical protein
MASSTSRAFAPRFGVLRSDHLHALLGAFTEELLDAGGSFDVGG